MNETNAGFTKPITDLEAIYSDIYACHAAKDEKAQVMKHIDSLTEKWRNMANNLSKESREKYLKDLNDTRNELGNRLAKIKSCKPSKESIVLVAKEAQKDIYSTRSEASKEMQQYNQNKEQYQKQATDVKNKVMNYNFPDFLVQD